MSAQFWIWVALGYLAGSIPTGVLLGRVAGRDPRQAGSGNIGASNVTRTLGKKLGALTLVIDAAKGALPTAMALSLVSLEVAAAVGVAAVLGHCFPVWLKFKGGKGVATAFGTMAALVPMIAVVSMLVWIVAVVMSRTPAIGSLIAAVLFVVLPYVDGQPFAVHTYAVLVAVVIVVRHTSNIRALRQRWAPTQSQQLQKARKKRQKQRRAEKRRKKR